MRPAIVDELEEFVRRGLLWQADELRGMVDLLEAEADDTADPIPRLVCTPLKSLLVRLGMGEVSSHTRVEIEAVVYPRLWKVMEAARDGLPDTELRTRIEVMNRRLSRVFAQE